MSARAAIALADCPVLLNAVTPGAGTHCYRARLKILPIAGVIAGLLFLSPRTAAADPFRLFESGTPGPDGQTDVSPFGDFQFIGLRFFVASTVTTEAIGGHMGGQSGMDVFGAIVALSQPDDFPDSRDLSTPDVRGAARIVLSPSGQPSRTQVFSAPLQVTLRPGWHALVFGSGLFGATGSGVLSIDNLPATGQCFFGGGGLTRPELGYQDGCFSVNRFYAFVDAQSAPTPEPSTLLLLGCGSAVLMRRRRGADSSGSRGVNPLE